MLENRRSRAHLVDVRMMKTGRSQDVALGGSADIEGSGRRIGGWLNGLSAFYGCNHRGAAFTSIVPVRIARRVSTPVSELSPLRTLT